MLSRWIFIVIILPETESASLAVYEAKLWSACSSLPLLPQPACWRANCAIAWAVGQFDVEAALRRHWRGKLAARASNCPTTRGCNSREQARGKEFPQASLREGKRQRVARTPKLRSVSPWGRVFLQPVHPQTCGEPGWRDLLFRSAAFRGHWGTSRGPKEQVRATRSLFAGIGGRSADLKSRSALHARSGARRGSAGRPRSKAGHV